MLLNCYDRVNDSSSRTKRRPAPRPSSRKPDDSRALPARDQRQDVVQRKLKESSVKFLDDESDQHSDEPETSIVHTLDYVSFGKHIPSQRHKRSLTYSHYRKRTHRPKPWKSLCKGRPPSHLRRP